MPRSIAGVFSMRFKLLPRNMPYCEQSSFFTTSLQIRFSAFSQAQKPYDKYNRDLSPASTRLGSLWPPSSKTAWVLCLTHMASTDNIVFGQLVNGRNLGLPEAEAVIGACVNYVPVLVTLQAACTVSKLLHAVYEYQTRSMAVETILKMTIW
ncbi:hypothetical protein BO83DRAFT_431611 [Aspergillus eucalypticola CBS 122712]|uniref:Condensation domain-containing protein n=1 Tax=Aspergillus eucalypticola (strain CBS 122712 / IBT 29274) TaxID=1448314 RepID=A0A317URE9_ASPEC|nr:uncharacterized protein BO83DRAFT_431611 [Aspergillus eucalypticola CBS 122712]PWY63658.1 hypothetical protein BO83DRAFT_431611 [Aspergillus eucalypticola CBS 122712]